jgi:hypothetical protein
MTEKVSKFDALYQSHPKGAQRCANCSMFRRPNACTKVSGIILPYGWSKYWERKPL